MDIILIIAGVLFLIVGLLGAVIPGIPGPLVSYLGLIFLQLTSNHSFTEDFLVIMGLIMAGVTVLDYVVPVYGTKTFGGTKRGIRGSTIGLVFGIIVLPLLGIVIGPLGLVGIILGPFIGAYLGELSGGTNSDKALKAAVGSFIGFLAGTMMKLIYSGVAGFYFFLELFSGG